MFVEKLLSSVKYSDSFYYKYVCIHKRAINNYILSTYILIRFIDKHIYTRTCYMYVSTYNIHMYVDGSRELSCSCINLGTDKEESETEIRGVKVFFTLLYIYLCILASFCFITSHTFEASPGRRMAVVV